MKAIVRASSVLLLAAVPLLAAAAKSPVVKVGDRYEYVTSGTGPQTPAAEMALPQGHGMIIPLPNRQVVRVTGEAPCPGGPCLTLEVEQVLPSFVPQLAKEEFVTHIRAVVQPSTGEVRDVRTTFRMGRSVSESSQKAYEKESTLGEFFGPWMVDLDDRYSRSFDRMGGEVRTFTVTGREKVAGRDCLVVRRTRRLPDGQKVEAVLWVDAARRVALQIEQDGRRMTLVKASG